MNMDRCEKCIIPKVNQSENLCLECRDNPIVQRVLMTLPRVSHYLDYMPTCPRGYTDCVCDPAYIQFHYPDWYKDLYGELTPEEAINVEGGCAERAKEDPDMHYYCYDDEDK